MSVFASIYYMEAANEKLKPVVMSWVYSHLPEDTVFTSLTSAMAGCNNFNIKTRMDESKNIEPQA
jgi:hypothetical protein